MSDLQKGRPTGKVDSHGRMMEVHMFRTDAQGTRINMGTRWVPVTEEQRKIIVQGNTQTVSMGAVVLTQEMKDRVYVESSFLGDPLKPDDLEETEEEAEAWNRHKSVRWPRPAEKNENAALLREVGDSMDTLGSTEIERLQARLEASKQDPTRGTLPPTLREWCNALGIDLDEQFRAMQKDQPVRKAYIDRQISKAYTVNLTDDVTGTTTLSELTPISSLGKTFVVGSLTLTRLADDRIEVSGAIDHPSGVYVCPNDWSLTKFYEEFIMNPPKKTEAPDISGLGYSSVDLTGDVTDSAITYKPTEESRQKIALEYALQLIDDFESQARVAEHSGHNVNYYSVPIKYPKRPERLPHIVEVEDLIQALKLNFHEGTVLKSLIRSATERELGLVKQGGDAIRDAQKMVHSSQELLRDRKIRQGENK